MVDSTLFTLYYTLHILNVYYYLKIFIITFFDLSCYLDVYSTDSWHLLCWCVNIVIFLQLHQKHFYWFPVLGSHLWPPPYWVISSWFSLETLVTNTVIHKQISNCESLRLKYPTHLLLRQLFYCTLVHFNTKHLRSNYLPEINLQEPG